jgi:ribose 1,5-bisphosphokinase
MAGRLIYVMGPSGVGKDSLMRYARERLAHCGDVLFAHRYITRPADAGGENHIALSDAEFRARSAQGCFALDWEAHGLRYGIGREIDLWLHAGLNVAVNGSREYFPVARSRYPDLAGILVEAAPALLAARLAARGRESAENRAARLERAELSTANEQVIRLANDGPIEVAGERLVNLMRQTASVTD